MQIETERLIITEFTQDMAQSVHENSLDEASRRFVPDEVFETPEDALETIEFLMEQYGSFDGPLVYPMLTKPESENIGYVQLVPMDDENWEVGYHIGEKYRGKGYATEAVTAFLPIIADAAGIREVQGICLKDNAASIRVLEKCHFKTVFSGVGTYQGEDREIVKTIWKR